MKSANGGWRFLAGTNNIESANRAFNYLSSFFIRRMIMETSIMVDGSNGQAERDVMDDTLHRDTWSVKEPS